MRQAREFWLTSENDSSVNIDLMDTNAFGSRVQGLGVGSKDDAYVAGQDVISSDHEYEFNDISFTVIMGGINDDPYYQYNLLIEQLNKLGLILHYRMDQSHGSLHVVEYERKVEFLSISKTETDYQLGVLASELSLKPTSPWYVWESNTDTNPRITRVTGLTLKGNGVTYSAATAYKIDTTNSIHLVPNKTIACKIERNMSQASNVIMMLFDEHYDLIHTLKFTHNFIAGDKFYFSSDFQDLYAKAGTTSILDKIETDSDGFLRIPAGKISYLYFGSGGINANDKMYIRTERVTV